MFHVKHPAKRLQAFVAQHQPVVAPVVMIGLIALFAVGAQCLDDLHAPTWLKWVIGVPYVAFMCLASILLGGADLEDRDN